MGLASFTWHHVFKVHPHCSIDQYFILFLWISNSFDNWWYHILFIHSSVDGHLYCSHFLSTMNNVAMSIYLWICVWIYVCFQFSWLGTWSSNCWIIWELYIWYFWETARLFSKEAISFYCLIAVGLSFLLSFSYPSIVGMYYFNN